MKGSTNTTNNNSLEMRPDHEEKKWESHPFFHFIYYPFRSFRVFIL